MAVTYTSGRKTAAVLTAGIQRVPPGTTLKLSLGAGDTSNPIYCNGDDVICNAMPANGGTVKWQASWSPYDDVVAGTATWFDWNFGAASSNQSQAVPKPTAVRAICATGASTAEVSK